MAEVIEHETAEQEAEAIEQALVAAEATSFANPLDMPIELFMAGLDRRGANRKALMKWVKGELKRGIDFDRIHVMSRSKCNKGKYCTNDSHFSKDTLFKPGAEKICGMLGLLVEFPSLSHYEAKVLNGEKIDQIIIVSHLVDASGTVVGRGAGARAVSQDYGDLNKALKMALKSAHLDATLRCAGLSEMFTQDVDQMEEDKERLAPVQQAAPAMALTDGDMVALYGHRIDTAPDMESLRAHFSEGWTAARTAEMSQVQSALKARYDQRKERLEFVDDDEEDGSPVFDEDAPRKDWEAARSRVEVA